MNTLRKITVNTYKLMIWTVILAGAILLAASFWITNTFGVITIDQMMMNLAGADKVDESVRNSFVVEVIAVPTATVAFLYLIHLTGRLILRRRKQSTPQANTSRARRVLLHGATKNIAFGIAGGLVLAFGTVNIANAVSLEQYIKASQTDLTMDKYYVNPSDTTNTITVLNSNEPRNLILIFLESIENDFSDREAFGEDLLAGIKKPTENWDSIDTLEMYNGGGWTMSGLISTMCGVPNRAAGLTPDNLNTIGNEENSFMSNATCLGDVLKEEGYTNIFLGGADKAFANKGTLLKTHGYDRILDYNVWEAKGETEMNSWGLGDERLFENAKQELAKLRQSNKPYNMTMLTVDSHEPAHLLGDCELRTEEQKPLAAATRCSMNHVGNFIKYLEQTGVLEDTVVVLTGDHLKSTAENGIFTPELGDRDNRTIFNRIWHPDYRTVNSAGETVIDTGIKRDRADQLDWYGTLLHLMNKGRLDGRAGVGTSIYQPSKNEQIEGNLGAALGLTDEQHEELITSHSTQLYRWLWGETASLTDETPTRSS